MKRDDMGEFRNNVGPRTLKWVCVFCSTLDKNYTLFHILCVVSPLGSLAGFDPDSKNQSNKNIKLSYKNVFPETYNLLKCKQNQRVQAKKIYCFILAVDVFLFDERE